jgi:hypothetical protein
MSFSKHFIDNLEIYLTGVALIIIFVVPSALGVHDYWRLLGLLAVAISVLHGVLFWLVRRRQRQVRLELIGEIRPMLADRIKNHLVVMLLAATERTEQVDQALTDAAVAAASEITKTLDQLSLDSLRRWEHHYQIQ